MTCFSCEENTEIKGACSLTWKNNFYVFGGHSQIYQISQIIDAKITSIGILSFIFYNGACSLMDNKKIFLCFSNYEDNKKRCRVALTPLGVFENVPETSYHHIDISIAASNCK